MYSCVSYVYMVVGVDTRQDLSKTSATTLCILVCVCVRVCVCFANDYSLETALDWLKQLGLRPHFNEHSLALQSNASTVDPVAPVLFGNLRSFPIHLYYSI